MGSLPRYVDQLGWGPSDPSSPPPIEPTMALFAPQSLASCCCCGSRPPAEPVLPASHPTHRRPSATPRKSVSVPTLPTHSRLWFPSQSSGVHGVPTSRTVPLSTLTALAALHPHAFLITQGPDQPQSPCTGCCFCLVYPSSQVST